eukprot:15449401-Alexandrium_andersonii.AAC.1
MMPPASGVRSRIPTLRPVFFRACMARPPLPQGVSAWRCCPRRGDSWAVLPCTHYSCMHLVERL